MSRVHEGPTPSDSPELAEYKEQCERSVNQTFHRWALILKAHGIDEVHVIYAAGEDDGGIEDTQFFRRVKDELAPCEPPPGMFTTHRSGTYEWTESALDSFMYDIMQARGFFNQNEGCQGVIRWAIDKDTLIHDHQMNNYGSEGEIANPDEPEEDQYRETTYVPQEVETYYGIDDIERKIGP